jgi:hypothetical protein
MTGIGIRIVRYDSPYRVATGLPQAARVNPKLRSTRDQIGLQASHRVERSTPTLEEPMTRRLIAAFVAATVGLGLSAQAMAGDWHRHGYHYRHDHNRDGRVDWRDHRYHGWDRGRHYGWDRGRHYGWDRSRHYDWRDRSYHRVDRNRDGRLDAYERSFARRDRNRDGVLSYREWGR